MQNCAECNRQVPDGELICCACGALVCADCYDASAHDFCETPLEPSPYLDGDRIAE